MKSVSVEYKGKQINASLNRGETLSGEVLGREEPPLWYLTIAGTALTKLPAMPDDTENSVRQRVLDWLSEHEDMLDRDQIVLGGG
jgi:hypothetical protein